MKHLKSFAFFVLLLFAYCSPIFVICYDVVVIGSGPAGCSAGLYAARANLSTLVITGDSPYGQLSGSHEVENWPGIPKKCGIEIMEQLHEQVRSFGVSFLYDTVMSIDSTRRPFIITTADQSVFEAHAIVIATGSSPKMLHVPGEDLYWGKGVSACAVCDCFLYKNKDVVIVGGGDSAVEEALQLVGYARSITILVRSHAMRAVLNGQKKLQEHADKIDIRYNSSIAEILGDVERGVTGVMVCDSASSQSYVLPIDGVFLAIGHKPNVDLFKDWIALDTTGHVALANRSQMTNIPGIFVAGDVADNRFKQAAKAAGDGVQAGMEAVEFVRFH